MKKRFYFLVISFLILAFTIILGFLLNSSLSIEEGKQMNLYYVVKAVCVISLLVVILFVAFNKKTVDYTMPYLTLIASLLLQLLPFVIRLLLHYKQAYIWSVIISFVFFILYMVFVLSTDILKDKVNKALPKLEGKKIEVTDDNQYYDDNGRFNGAK